jgi:hypothetical protein
MCEAINLFSEDCETKSESCKEDIERSKVAGSDDKHKAVFQRDITEMLWILLILLILLILWILWICMNDVYLVHIQFIVLISTIIDHRICFQMFKID